MATETRPSTDGQTRSPWLKRGLIGCGALLAVCVLLTVAVVVIGALVGDDDDDPDTVSQESTPTIDSTLTPTEAPDEQSAVETPSDVGDEEDEPTFTSEPSPAPPPTETPVPTATAEPTPESSGSERSNPLPVGETGQTNEWEVQILEVIRGEDAWARILEANQFNEPAPEGHEYILINVRVKYMGDSAEAQRVDGSWFRSTGDARVKHEWASVVEPEPAMDFELFPDAEASGWVTVLARQGEGNMIAIFEPIFSVDEDDELFMALDQGANVQPLTDRLAEGNELGFDRNSPVLIGEHVVGDTWELWVIEAVRGDDALQRVKDANMFNEGPAEGMEYVAVHIGARNVKPDAGSDSVSEFTFKSTGDAGRVYDSPSVVDPEPNLNYDVYAGGEVHGWIVVQVGSGEQNIKLVYEPLFSLTGHPRYFALE